MLANGRKSGLSDVGHASHVLRGPTPALTDGLLKLARLGFGGFNLSLAGRDWAGQLESIGREVVPVLHAAD